MPSQEAATKSPGPQAHFSLSSFFTPGGLIAQTIKGFEPRKQQTEMALVVQKSLSEAKHLVVEAGTGVGKSLAYLVPAGLWAINCKRKILVATYTKALQEQLTKKDLPIVREALQKAGLPFQYFLLMGAANYLCLRRLQRCLEQGPELLDDGSKTMLAGLEDWAGTDTLGQDDDSAGRGSPGFGVDDGESSDASGSDSGSDSEY